MVQAREAVRPIDAGLCFGIASRGVMGVHVKTATAFCGGWMANFGV